MSLYREKWDSPKVGNTYLFLHQFNNLISNADPTQEDPTVPLEGWLKNLSLQSTRQAMTTLVVFQRVGGWRQKSHLWWFFLWVSAVISKSEVIVYSASKFPCCFLKSVFLTPWVWLSNPVKIVFLHGSGSLTSQCTWSACENTGGPQLSECPM